MAGPWQHYLPAAYLAGFAASASPRPRETPLWIGRRGKQPFQQTAERVGAQRDIYTLVAPTTFDAGYVDAVWGGTEGYFQIAIERLITSRPTSSSVTGALVAELWAKVLVPFVTQFFVRGPDFAARQRLRMGEQLYAVLSRWPNHHNYARMLEYQRLLTVVSVSEWMVMHFPPDVPAIATDTGRARMVSSRLGGQGYFFPLRRDAVLMVRAPIESHWAPRVVSGKATGDGDKWIAGPIAHRNADAETALQCNRVLAQHARHEIYGGTAGQVSGLLPHLGPSPVPLGCLEPYLLTSHENLRNQDLQYFRLLSLLAKPPSATPRSGEIQISDTDIDFNAVKDVLPYFLHPAGGLSPDQMWPKPSSTLLVDVGSTDFLPGKRPVV